MTQPQNGGQMAQIAPVVSMKTTHANGSVTAGDEKRWTLFDHCGDEMHDVSSSSAKARGANTLRGRSSPRAKTTHAKHTRRTTPASPSSRFNEKPSLLVTSRPLSDVRFG